MIYRMAARRCNESHRFERVDREGGKTCAEDVADAGGKLQAGSLQRRFFCVENRAVAVERGEVLRQIKQIGGNRRTVEFASGFLDGFGEGRATNGELAFGGIREF